MVTHSPVKQTLKKAGLKMNLARLRVINTFWEASGEQGRVPVRTLHRRLSETGMPLSLVNIRQVLGRLVESGLVTLDEQDVYSPGKAFWGGAAGPATSEHRVAASEQRL